MISSANTGKQIRFNYVNVPTNTVRIVQSQTNCIQPIKIQQNIRSSEQKTYKIEGFSTLELQTRKDLASQKRLSQGSLKVLDIVPIPESTSVLETHQSLHKAEQLDPIKQSIAPRAQIPLLKADNSKSEAPKFKIQGLQEIRESDFFKSNNNDANNNISNQNGQQSFQSYNRNPHSNLYSRGPENNQNQSDNHHHHGKRLLKQIKTFKIGKIQQKKQSEFTGCCGFGITDKVAFLSKDH